MGFYLRKSVRVGPFRFNLSKSGIGVSAGIRGLRVGSGPRGNYVHMGRGGVYYRTSLPSGSPAGSRPLINPTPAPIAQKDGLTEIESGNVLEMVDSSSAALLEELNAKRRKSPLWILTLSVAVALGAFFGRAFTPILLLGIAVAFLVAQWDAVRRTTVLFYELEGNSADAYQSLIDVFEEFSKCGRVGHIGAEGATTDRKRHAGASTLVRRITIQPGTTLSPPLVKTNVAVPSIPVGRQRLYFFPDRLLVFDKAGIGAVSYSSLKLDVAQTRFIENESVPRDAKVVGQTWKYVNKTGGPDRRFKDNRQLPIALYEEIRLKSESGLNEALQVSLVGVGEHLRVALQRMSMEGATTEAKHVPTASTKEASRIPSA